MAVSSSPKISVVVISYNFDKFLGECMESLLAQTLRPFEIIVCDDHSTDRSWAVIEKYGRRHPKLVRAFRQERNLGPFENGTFGAQKVRGELVSFIDGDDRWLPGKLQLEWRALQATPGAELAYSNVHVIDAQGTRKATWHEGPGPMPSGDVFVEVFSKRFFPEIVSVFRNELVTRLAFELEGHSDSELGGYWDWDMKIRYSARFPVACSAEALVEYRMHPGGFHYQDPAGQLRAMIQVYKKNEPLLRGRSSLEVARVRCHLESLIAWQQKDFPPEQFAKDYSAGNVLGRIAARLRRLSPQDRATLEGELAPSMKRLLGEAARRERNDGHSRSSQHQPRSAAP